MADILKEKDVKLSEDQLKSWYVEKLKEHDRGSRYDHYCLMDINQDGITDLLVSSNSLMDMLPDSGSKYWLAYTYQYGNLETLDAADFNLCENGVLEEIDEYRDDPTVVVILHTFVRLQGNEKQTLDRLFYNRTDDTWSRDRKGTQPITKEEAQTILAKYPRIDQGMRPIFELLG